MGGNFGELLLRDRVGCRRQRLISGAFNSTLGSGDELDGEIGMGSIGMGSEFYRFTTFHLFTILSGTVSSLDAVWSIVLPND